MQTVPMFAHEVEDEDFVVYAGHTYQVSSTDDEGDFILLDARDDNGDPAHLPKFAPFDVVTVVLSFEDADLDLDVFVDVPDED